MEPKGQGELETEARVLSAFCLFWKISAHFPCLLYSCFPPSSSFLVWERETFETGSTKKGKRATD